MYFIRDVLSCFCLCDFIMITYYILTHVTRISINEGRFLVGLTEGGLCDLKRVSYQNCSCYVRKMDNLDLIYLSFHNIDLV